MVREEGLTMRELILISPRCNEEKNIIGQWKHKSIFCDVVSDGRITLETKQGLVFIDFGDSESMYPFYDEEGNDFDIRNYFLYCISFSDLAFVKDFLNQTKFDKGCKLDNDHGMIIDYKDLKYTKGFFDCYSWGLDSNDVEKAHRYCTANEGLLSESTVCGCFYCLKVFAPSEIENWINDRDGKTAICPYCSIDSVLPGNRVDLSKSFLNQMHKAWF